MDLPERTSRTETPPPTAELSDNVITDPPPPYPTPRGTRRQRRSAPRHGIHTQISSNESHSDQDGGTSPLADYPSSPSTDEDEGNPFLSATQGHLRNLGQRRRRRSISHASTISAAPSLAHTVLSLFDVQDDEDEEPEGQICLPEEELDDRHLESFTHDQERSSCDRDGGVLSAASWRRYFRPMIRPKYYRSMVHLLFINFPYALLAWVYLFVFTVTGTTLLVALPLGALFCFLDLIGARAFARGELAIQTTFHSPLSYPPPYPPRPIFTRYREATTQEIEGGRLASGRTHLVKERSFYKNTYAMFTDPTSYQALFYFIVIKPAITIILLLFVLIFAIPALVLVLPAPSALRACRRLGKWQANVAVDGLYHAVR